LQQKTLICINHVNNKTPKTVYLAEIIFIAIFRHPVIDDHGG